MDRVSPVIIDGALIRGLGLSSGSGSITVMLERFGGSSWNNGGR
jgi:hypothetical protein